MNDIHKDVEPSITDALAGSFAMLMMKHRDALYRYIYSLHPITDEIDDLMQDTAVTLWKKIEDYDESRDFLPWALRFAYFEVLRWRKHMSNRRFVLSEGLINDLSQEISEQEHCDEMRHAALQDCLKKLSKQERLIIDQRYSNKGTLKDLAQRLSISIHKVYHSLDRARESLACCVQKKLNQ